MKREDNAKGGHTASQKVYYCYDCQSIGQGQKMVSHHLQGYRGQGRKTKKSTEALKHRLEEAKFNTDLWHKQKVEAELRIEYKEAKQRILDSIQEMRSIFGNQFEATLEAFYKQIF